MEQYLSLTAFAAQVGLTVAEVAVAIDDEKLVAEQIDYALSMPEAELNRTRGRLSGERIQAAREAKAAKDRAAQEKRAAKRKFANGKPHQ